MLGGKSSERCSFREGGGEGSSFISKFSSDKSLELPEGFHCTCTLGGEKYLYKFIHYRDAKFYSIVNICQSLRTNFIGPLIVVNYPFGVFICAKYILG
jgi:hypothetical protein